MQIGNRLTFNLSAPIPNALFNDVKAANGNTILFEAILKPEDIKAAQGLTASYYRNANWKDTPFLVRKETQFNFDWHDGDPAAFPLGVEWQGVLYAPSYGVYRLIIRNPAAVELNLDQVPVTLKGDQEQTAEVLLAEGTHNFRLRTQAKAGHFELAWQPPSEKETTLPISSLLTPSVGNNGLLGRYYPDADWQGLPALMRVDAWIHFYYQNIPLARPYTAEWVGNVNITQGGHYHFGLESIDESTLFIDQKQVLNNLTPNQYQETELDLLVGLHPIRLRFSDRTGSTHVNLYWTPPNGQMEPVPQEVLFPPQGEADLLDPAMSLAAAVAPAPDSNPVSQAPQTAAAAEITPTFTNSSIKAGGIPNLTEIEAKLLWQTGACGSASGQFQAPHGITLDPQGHLWIADTGNQRLVEINQQGQFMQSLGQGGEGDAQFHSPFDLVAEQDGSLVVLDTENVKVLKRFASNGDFRGFFGIDLGVYNPRGVAIDHDGNLYLADTGGNRLLRLSAAGMMLQQWRSKPNESGMGAGQPVSVTIGADGRIYLVEATGGLAWAVSADGTVS